MKTSVYLDTTIPAFYYDEREGSAYRKQKTREWWDTQRRYFDCYTSLFMRQETEQGCYKNQEQIVSFARKIPVLKHIEEIDGIIDIYIKNFVMPNDSKGDAAHLAMASYHAVDYLLTWNCKHLANAFKYAHIQKINLRLGLMTPMIVTPEQLFMEEEND